MLKLEPDAFMVEVSRAISEKPWKHVRYGGKRLNPQRCVMCGKTWPSWQAWMDRNTACPVPPRLTESPAELAFRLRDEVVAAGKADLMEVKMPIIRAGSLAAFHAGADANTERTLRWWGRDATPFEVIAMSLVALGLWGMRE